MEPRICTVPPQPTPHDYTSSNVLQAAVEVEELEPRDPALIATIKSMNERGIQTLYGRWLIDGAPRVLLFDTSTAYHKLDEWKGDLWSTAGIPSPPDDSETNETIVFGYLIAWFLGEVCSATGIAYAWSLIRAVCLPRKGTSCRRPVPRVAVRCRHPPVQEAPHGPDHHLHDARDSARTLPLRGKCRFLQQPPVL